MAAILFFRSARKGCPKQFPNGGEGLFSKEERDMGKDQWMRKSIINKDQKYRYDCKVLDIMLVWIHEKCTEL